MGIRESGTPLDFHQPTSRATARYQRSLEEYVRY